MKSIVERFSIKGLFGKKNVNLEFKNNVQIYIGENGLGKTTVLKLFYSMLTGKFADMMDVEFSEIFIKLNNKSYQFSKTELKGYIDKDKSLSRRSSLFRHLFNILDDEDVSKLQRIFSSQRQDEKGKKEDAVFGYFFLYAEESLKLINITYHTLYQKYPRHFCHI